MRRILRNSACIAAIVLISSCCWAAESDTETEGGLCGVEVLVGFGTAQLDEKQTYHPITVFVDFDFDLVPLTEKFNFTPPGLLQFTFEPFASYSYQPESNGEIGNNFLIKIGFAPQTWRLQPYFKGGLGMIYLSQRTREQSTKFNFNEHAGLGLHYYFTDDKRIAFTTEYRYRHISNAGIKSPNSGIDTHYGICGLSYRF